MVLLLLKWCQLTHGSYNSWVSFFVLDFPGDIQNGSGGWAYMPYNAGDDQYDGVVIESNYDKLGFPKGYVRKTVLPHEVGHWLVSVLMWSNNFGFLEPHALN